MKFTVLLRAFWISTVRSWIVRTTYKFCLNDFKSPVANLFWPSLINQYWAGLYVAKVRLLLAAPSICVLLPGRPATGLPAVSRILARTAVNTTVHRRAAAGRSCSPLTGPQALTATLMPSLLFPQAGTRLLSLIVELSLRSRLRRTVSALPCSAASWKQLHFLASIASATSSTPEIVWLDNLSKTYYSIIYYCCITWEWHFSVLRC